MENYSYLEDAKKVIMENTAQAFANWLDIFEESEPDVFNEFTSNPEVMKILAGAWQIKLDKLTVKSRKASLKILENNWKELYDEIQKPLPTLVPIPQVKKVSSSIAEIKQIDIHKEMSPVQSQEGFQYIKKIQDLIDKEGINGKDDDDGYTPLHLAVRFQPEAVASLIKAGADVNVEDDMHNETPLHLAAALQPNVIVTLLNAGADATAKSSNGSTPLHLLNSLEGIAPLIKAGADVNATNNDGWTLLHVAAAYQPNFITTLIAVGADVNIKDKQGKKPIDYAKNDETKALLAAPAITNPPFVQRWKNNVGDTPNTVAIDGNIVAVGFYNGIINILDKNTGSTLNEIDTDPDGDDDNADITAITIQGDLIAVGTSGKNIYLIDKKTGTETHNFSFLNGTLFITLNGDKVISGSIKGDITMWNKDTQKLYHKVTVSPQKNEIVRGIAVKGDTAVVAIGKNITVLKNYEVKQTIKAKHDIFSVAMDDDLIVGGDKEGNVILWDKNDGKLLKTFENVDHKFIDELAIDGNYIVVARTVNKVVKILNKNSGTIIQSIDVEDDVQSIAMQNGTIVIATDDDTVEIWDNQQKVEVKIPPKLEQPNNFIIKFEIKEKASNVLIEGDNIISTNDKNKTVNILHKNTGELLKTFGPNKAFTYKLAVDGDIIASYIALGNTIEIWNKKTGGLIRTISVDCAVSAVAIQEKNIAYGCHKKIYVWNINTGGLVRTINESDIVNNIVIDGDLIASANDDDNIKIWNISTGKLMHTFDLIGANSVIIDGNTIIGAGEDLIQIWNKHTGQLLKTIDPHCYTSSIAVDGNILVSACKKNSIMIWDKITGDLLQTIEIIGKYPSISMQKDTLVIAGRDAIQIYKKQEPKLQLPPKTAFDPMQMLKQSTKLVKPNVVDELKNESKIYLQTLSKEQKEILVEYTGNDYVDMNSCLRGLSKDECKKGLATLDVIIANGPTNSGEIILFRGINPAKPGGQELSMLFAKMDVGEFWEERGFLSSSYDKPQLLGHKCCTIEIHVPPGVHMIAVESVSKHPGESEVLLAPGMGLQLKQKTQTETGVAKYVFNCKYCLPSERFHSSVAPTHLINVPTYSKKRTAVPVPAESTFRLVFSGPVKDENERKEQLSKELMTPIERVAVIPSLSGFDEWAKQQVGDDYYIKKIFDYGSNAKVLDLSKEEAFKPAELSETHAYLGKSSQKLYGAIRDPSRLEKLIGCPLFTTSCIEEFRDYDPNSSVTFGKLYKINEPLKHVIVLTMHHLCTIFGKQVMYPVLQSKSASEMPYLISGTTAINYWIQTVGHGRVYGYPVIPTQDFDIKMDMKYSKDMQALLSDQLKKVQQQLLRELKRKADLDITELQLKWESQQGGALLTLVAYIKIPDFTKETKREWFTFPIVDISTHSGITRVHDYRIKIHNGIYLASPEYVKKDICRLWGQHYKKKRREAKYIYWNLVFPKGNRLHQPQDFVCDNK